MKNEIKINPDRIYRQAARTILKLIDDNFKEEITRVALKQFSDKLSNKSGKLTIDESVLLACYCCEDINPVSLYKNDRHKQTVVARWLVMWYIHRHLKKTCTFSGAIFGKDHATALHGIKKVDYGTKQTLGTDVFEWISKFKNAIN